MDAIAFVFEEANDARQHMVVAALGEAQQERKCFDCAKVDPQFVEVRPVDAADLEALFRAAQRGDFAGLSV